MGSDHGLCIIDAHGRTVIREGWNFSIESPVVKMERLRKIADAMTKMFTK